MSKKYSAGQDLWIFGYGSLMWDPGFSVAESSPALLKGSHGRFSVYSNGSYGRPDCPGLALGLHPGGSCRARAFRVEPKDAEKTFAYLDRRESAYLRRRVAVTFNDGATIWMTTYVSNPQHPRFAGDLLEHEITHLILTGSGSKGTSLAYLENTVRELEGQGMTRSNMHDLLNRVHKFAAEKRIAV